MLTIHHSNEQDLEPCILTIGFFDGVHGGHRFLIEQVKETARSKHLKSGVVTFVKHPRQVMNQSYCPQLLNNTDEKQTLLAQSGIDYLIWLDFTPDMAALSAYEFMSELKTKYHAQALVIGYDHRFGHNRSEGFEDYRRYGKELGIEVIQAAAYINKEGVEISSSLIRSSLQNGDVSKATEYLGYPYSLSGKVVDGYKQGRLLGFPTANLQVDDANRLIPADGVYAVYTETAGRTYMGMLNIGHRPTIGNGPTRSIEVHLLDLHTDLYGQTLRISFIQRLRAEIHFNNREELKVQLQQDAEEVRKLLCSTPLTPTN